MSNFDEKLKAILNAYAMLRPASSDLEYHTDKAFKAIKELIKANLPMEETHRDDSALALMLSKAYFGEYNKGWNSYRQELIKKLSL